MSTVVVKVKPMFLVFVECCKSKSQEKKHTSLMNISTVKAFFNIKMNLFDKVFIYKSTYSGYSQGKT